MIITIGRECGCEAEDVAKLLSEKLNIPYYNKEEITEKAKEKNLYKKYPNFFKEKQVNSLLYSIAVGENDLTYKTPEKIFKELFREKEGIIVGRASNFAFKNDPDVVKVFLTGEKEKRIQKIKDKYDVSENKAKMIVEETDYRRRNYHNYYTGELWGNSNHYDLCICETKLGVSETANCIIDYIERMNKQS